MQEEIVEQVSNNEIVHSEFTQFLTFELNKEAYGINILKIKEIIDYRNITKVPMMPEFIAGVINLRGNVVPVINLALRFSQEPTKRTKRSSIVIMEIFCEEQIVEIGITVDVVNEVLDILTSEIKASPSFGTLIRSDFISGMGEINSKLLVFLDMENILAVEELSVVNESMLSNIHSTAAL